MLEGSVIDTLASFGIEAGRVKEYPGVWVGGGERKVCAVGVHLRRNVASFGVGLNVNPDLKWFEEIIACGLPGDKTTSIEKEGVTAGVEDVAERFVEMARKRMKLETMEKGDWKEILWLYGGKEVVKEAMTEDIW